MKSGGPLRPCGKRYATEAAARYSKRGLLDGAMFIPCAFPACGGWHVAIPKAAAARKAPAPRALRVDALTRCAVLERDGYCCVCCGRSIIGQRYSLQHRDACGMGGSKAEHSGCSCNLITMLGSGTTLCHGRVEANTDPADEAKGYALRSGQVPRLTSVMVFGPDGGSSRYPSCDGEWTTVAPSLVAA